MYRKIFLVGFPLLIVSVLSALIFQNNNQYTKGTYSPATILLQASILLLLGTAIGYGSMRKRPWIAITECILFLVLIAVVLLRLRVTIELDLLVLICPPTAAIIYLIHFFTKKGKRWFTDIVKLLFVLSSLLTYQAVLLGTRYEDEILGSWVLCFLLLSIVVYRQVYRSRPPVKEEELASEGNDIFVYKDQ